MSLVLVDGVNLKYIFSMAYYCFFGVSLNRERIESIKQVQSIKSIDMVLQVFDEIERNGVTKVM